MHTEKSLKCKHMVNKSFSYGPGIPAPVRHSVAGSLDTRWTPECPPRNSSCFGLTAPHVLRAVGFCLFAFNLYAELSSVSSFFICFRQSGKQGSVETGHDRGAEWPSPAGAPC